MTRCTLAWALVALAASCAGAPPRPILVAISGITPMIPDGNFLSATASDLIEDRLVRSGRFQIARSDRLATHPAESPEEYARCLGAEWAVSGAITEADVHGQVGEVLLHLRVVDVESGTVVFSRDCRGAAEGRSPVRKLSLLNRAVQNAAQELVQEVIKLTP